MVQENRFRSSRATLNVALSRRSTPESIFVSVYLLNVFKCARDARVCCIADRHSPDTYMDLRAADRQARFPRVFLFAPVYIPHARNRALVEIAVTASHIAQISSISLATLIKRPFEELCNRAGNEYARLAVPCVCLVCSHVPRNPVDFVRTTR